MKNISQKIQILLSNRTIEYLNLENEITHHIQRKEHILYIYSSALDTSKIKGSVNENLEKIVKNLKKYNGEYIISVLIKSKEFEGNKNKVILLNENVDEILGVYSKY